MNFFSFTLSLPILKRCIYLITINLIVYFLFASIFLRTLYLCKFTIKKIDFNASQIVTKMIIKARLLV
jgi:hypothetical protein